MNQQEKEEYLREYAILKSKGKPFFPYAVAKDSAMACVVMAVIIAMSLILGAELGSKANPTTTTYVPRPEWYFFFLFEVLRVIKPPALDAARDDRRADARDDPAVPAAVLRPRARAPPRAPPDRDERGHRGDHRDGLPDLSGRERGLADGDRIRRRRRPSSKRAVTRRAQYEAGKLVVAQSGCEACHKIGDNGNAGPGPNLTHIASRIPRQAIARTLVNPTAPMPSFKNLPPAKFQAIVNFLSQLK